MARLIAALAAFLLPLAGFAQAPQDPQFQAAGVCGRCHVISVVEWGMSKHRQASTGCVACHGTSQGHIVDERNNIKPERMPHGAAIAALCADCHQQGCPKTHRSGGCQDCHHVHALVNPNRASTAKDQALADRTARWERFDRLSQEGESLLQAGQWETARTRFQAALQEKPGDPLAAARLKVCERRLHPGIPGFEAIGNEYDPSTGLPRRVRLSGLDLAMVLVPGGRFEMGSDLYASAKPVHTVPVAAFYLAIEELSQAAWKSLMGANPSAHQGEKFAGSDRLPVEQVSWEDCQALVVRLNERIAGGGFRLPTEAEWEFAARAGAAPAESAGGPAPQPVAAGSPDRLGLLYMRGNVWEWTSSLARPYPYSASDGRESPSAFGLRVLRGGGYADSPDWFDPGARHSERPNRRLSSNGLRLARSIPE